MSKWINEEDWPLVDYGELSEEEKEFNNTYVTESIPTVEYDDDGSMIDDLKKIRCGSL